MFTIVPAIFSANTIINDHNKANFVQAITVTKYRSTNLNSEFISNSSFVSSENFSQSSFFSSREKSEFLKRSSIAKDSSFSNKPSLQPKPKDDKFLETSFSVHDDSEFSGGPSSTPQYDRGEFSNMPIVSSKNISNTP